MTSFSVRTHSLSVAEDLGYEALNDLAAAADGLEYRVVGGHMVQMLLHLYPTPLAVMRTTGDADAGIDRATAAGQHLHDALTGHGYVPTAGNSYQKPDGDDYRSVDLLVPFGKAGGSLQVNGRGFDTVPGLSLALALEPVHLLVTAELFAGGARRFTIPVPDVECAIVLKALAWQSRKAPKDAHDLNSLLEVAYLHSSSLQRPWELNSPSSAATGTRGDAANAMQAMLPVIDRGALPVGANHMASPRMSALIRQLVHQR